MFFVWFSFCKQGSAQRLRLHDGTHNRGQINVRRHFRMHEQTKTDREEKEITRTAKKVLGSSEHDGKLQSIGIPGVMSLSRKVNRSSRRPPGRVKWIVVWLAAIVFGGSTIVEMRAADVRSKQADDPAHRLFA